LGNQGNIIIATILQEVVNIIYFPILIGMTGITTLCRRGLLDEMGNLALG
jgi:hypothetical protein